MYSKLSEYHSKINKIKENQLVIFNVPYIDGKNIIVKIVDDLDDTISLLVKWRNRYGEWFDTKFFANNETTKKWINNKIIEDIERVLFLIIYNDQKIGHFGLDNYNEKDNSIFITDVIRGERGFAPGLMTIVFNQFIKWIQNELKISIIRLRVFDDDDKAIALYKKCGFRKMKSIPMYKELTEDGWKWVEVKEVDQNPKRFFDVMEF